MTTTLEQIWRHPIKGIGAEALDHVDLTEGRPLPLDRAWAVLQDGGESSDGWRSCRNFLRGAKGPELMAVTSRMAGDGVVHLSHPKLPDLPVQLLDGPAPALFDWLKEIYPADRPAPASLVKAPEIGMADANFASVAVLNLASLRALSQKAGHALDPRRFRGNLWLDGLAPWEEFDLVGKTLAIGQARLEIVEPIWRCRATEANPETGQRDTNTLNLLEASVNDTTFGIYAKVTAGGAVSVGDTVQIQ